MLVAILLLISLVGVDAVPPTESALLAEVIETVEKTLEFFAEDYSAINVDGLFGLRIGQGMKCYLLVCINLKCTVILMRRIYSVIDL